MKKTIEIKERKAIPNDCSHECLMCRYVDGGNRTECVLGLQDHRGKPGDDCLKPGKYRMTLEKIEEFDCPRCESVQEWEFIGLDSSPGKWTIRVRCLKCECIFERLNNDPYQLIQEKQEFIIE